jgi:NADH-quinone oxidoreductase subunit E
MSDTKEFKNFKFTEANLKKAKEYIAKYPEGKQRSAIKSLLYLAQKQCGGWLPRSAREYVGEMLGLAPIRVDEVATFYSMFYTEPVGENLVQVCTTTPCWLRGSDDVLKACKKSLGIDVGETTKDNKFTIVEVECLGACANAPLVQINEDYYEDLNFELTEELLENIKKGKKVKVGSQIGRICSRPHDQATVFDVVEGKK